MKIIIIDDKLPTESHSFRGKLNNIPNNQRDKVRFFHKIDNAIFFNEDRNEIIDLHEDFTNSAWLMVHKSINNPFISHPDMLLDGLPKDCGLILFSGEYSDSLTHTIVDDNNSWNNEENPEACYYAISRIALFHRLDSFLDSFKKLGYYDLNALKYSDYNLHNAIVDEVIKIFEINSIEQISEPRRLTVLFEQLDYSSTEIENFLSNNTPRQIIDKLKTLKQ